MTSRLLTTTLSPLLTRPRTISSLTLKGPTFGHSTHQSTHVGPTMPVIHAVAAHRHCHSLCPVTDPRGHHYAKSRSDGRGRRPLSFLSVEPLLVEGCHVPSRPLSTTSSYWLKVRNKCFLSGGGKTVLNIIGEPPLVHEHFDDIEPRRCYSKTKDKGGAKKKTAVVINEAEMNEAIDAEALRTNLEGVLKQMKDEYASQLSIRGTAGALELLEVDFEGEKYPLQELAQIGRKNPQLIVLNLASLPDACKPVIQAIQESGMQLTPQQEGTTIYIPLPKITREHRENLAKNAKTIFTKYKTAFQNVQNRYIKQCKSHKEVSEDTVFSVSQQIMKLTEMYIVDAEKVMHDKQKELLDTIS